MSRTYAILEVTSETYREIEVALTLAGYDQAFHQSTDGHEVIDMNGIALVNQDRHKT